MKTVERMRKDSAKTFVLMMALLSWSAPMPLLAVNPCEGGGSPVPSADGIGGTGRALPLADEQGIGGTGRHPGVPDEGGIGGTGIGADLAVVGTITGFASICVGGTEIHYTNETPVVVDGRTGNHRDLRVGQVVEVLAGETGGAVVARAVSIRHEVVGPVSSVDLERKQVTVLGQTIELESSMWGEVTDALVGGAAASINLGETIAVYGYRQDETTIVATRVDRSASEKVVLVGPVTGLDSAGLSVAGVGVRATGTDRRRLVPGDSVRTMGRWNGTFIEASDLALQTETPFDAPVGRLHFEALARGRGNRRHVVINGVKLNLPADPGSSVEPGVRMRVNAVRRGGKFIAEKARPLAQRLRPMRRDGARPGSGGRKRLPEGRKGGSDLTDPRSVVGPGAQRPERREPPPVRPPKAERPERGVRPARVVRPERPSRPERPARPERPPRPERPIRPRRR